jgi:hypothetical protein
MTPERPFIGTSLTTARWVAALAFLFSSSFAVSALTLHALSAGSPRIALQTIDVLAWATGALTYAVVGLVVAWRRSSNAVGWVFQLIGLLGTSGVLGVSYATFAAATGAPGGAIAAWYSSCELAVGTGFILIIFLLLFPTGRLPSRLWIPVLGLGFVGIAFTTIGLALSPGELIAFPVENPVRVAGAAAPAIGLVRDVGIVFLVVAAIAALGSVVVRLLSADHVERQQLKWMGAAVGVLALAAVVNVVQGTGRTGFGEAGSSLALDCIPVAAGIAILRYRLYEIDRLVHRTFVYGATSAAIALTFFASIVALQPVLRPLTSGSELTVAASTLLSFGLFQPIRRRVQDAVNRRFDRSRYDAARTLDLFADRLRDEVDLDALRGDLLSAVHTTMSPAHASLWLREGTR